jgi:hypothetical protein
VIAAEPCDHVVHQRTKPSKRMITARLTQLIGYSPDQIPVRLGAPICPPHDF